MKLKIVVNRILSNEHKTLSECTLLEHGIPIMEFKGIELPWLNNKRNVSCIPENLYRAVAVRRASFPHKYAIWILDVPQRSQIMIHTANYARQLLGCLAPGRGFKDIDNDGIIDVYSSQDVMDELERRIALGTEFEVHFIDRFRIIGNLDPKKEKKV